MLGRQQSMNKRFSVVFFGLFWNKRLLCTRLNYQAIVTSLLGLWNSCKRPSFHNTQLWACLKAPRLQPDCLSNVNSPWQVINYIHIAENKTLLPSLGNWSWVAVVERLQLLLLSQQLNSVRICRRLWLWTLYWMRSLPTWSLLQHKSEHHQSISMVCTITLSSSFFFFCSFVSYLGSECEMYNTTLHNMAGGNGRSLRSLQNKVITNAGAKRLQFCSL